MSCREEIAPGGRVMLLLLIMAWLCLVMIAGALWLTRRRHLPRWYRPVGVGLVLLAALDVGLALWRLLSRE